MNVVLIDNYDSFVYNLARYVGELGAQRKVVRNDKISIAQIEEMRPTHIIISPGPCTPNEAGISLQAIKYFSGKIPILGICLGHQAIGQAFGGSVVRAKRPMHGMSAAIKHVGTGVFLGVPENTRVARYHSLIVDQVTLPPTLEVTARSDENEIMALKHKENFVFGLQFHPESILTQHGYMMLNNFLDTRILKPGLTCYHFCKDIS
jgi:para-aminobenzoate synthetase component 2